MRTSNPAFSERAFSQVQVAYEPEARTMSLQGTVGKTALLLLLALVGASIGWWMTGIMPAALWGMVIGSVIVGMILAFVIMFKPTLAPVLAPLYALIEGVFLGALTAVMETIYPGIATQAVAITFGVAGAMLLGYTTRIVRATEKFKAGVMAATGGIALVYLTTFILHLFNVQVPFIHQSGWIGIGFSLFVVIIAALNLVLDFDMIETGVKAQAPKYMEWYGAFGLMVTLVWLYIEILRLLSLISGRD